MLEKIVYPLIQWYEEDHRSLPWREDKNPYYIWISEIMLQQTRVEAVKPYFQRFIRELPTVKAVAVCPEEQLLKLWEGLGYYNRVRNIQKAARLLMEQYEGVLPRDYEQLKKLPGIGNYTAGAVASIAYDLAVPAVDGNVLRVIARITENYEDILKQSVKSRVERELSAVMPKDKPGIFNQALMELGAMVCLPNGFPKCEECPVASLCAAYENQTVMELPVKKKAKERRQEQKTVVVLRDGDRVAIRKRPGRGLLAGLYELPNLEGHCDETQLLQWLKKYEVFPLQIKKLEDSKHIFSHVEWNMVGYMVRVAQLDVEKEQDLIFAQIADIEEKYPVPTAFRAYTSYMNMKLGMKKQKDESTYK